MNQLIPANYFLTYLQKKTSFSYYLEIFIHALLLEYTMLLLSVLLIVYILTYMLIHIQQFSNPMVNRCK